MKHNLSDKAKNRLQKIEINQRERITKKIKFYIEQDNPLLFAKTLGNGFYRFRVGDYRVIFYIDEDIIQIVDVNRRDKIYK